MDENENFFFSVFFVKILDLKKIKKNQKNIYKDENLKI